MIIDHNLAYVLRQAGYYVPGLPDIEPCSHCGGVERIEITRRFISDTHSISCGCGAEGQSMVKLAGAIIRWNTAQRENRQCKARTAERAAAENLYP